MRTDNFVFGRRSLVDASERLCANPEGVIHGRTSLTIGDSSPPSPTMVEDPPTLKSPASRHNMAVFFHQTFSSLAAASPVTRRFRVGWIHLRAEPRRPLRHHHLRASFSAGNTLSPISIGRMRTTPLLVFCLRTNLCSAVSLSLTWEFAS